jgi:hypothetical protein
MKRIILSCDRCGSPHDVHESVYLEMSVGNVFGEQQCGRRYGHDQLRRDLCENCCREIKDQTSEIWMSMKPEALKLKEVK